MLITPQNYLKAEEIGPRLDAVRARMEVAAAAHGRLAQSVTLVAVSKGHAVDDIRAAAALGLRNFGESYVQEAVPKVQALRDLPLVWHFIGRIQANKTRTIAEHFDWVHGVDRLSIAGRLSTQRPHHAPPLNVCIEVNVGADSAKGGVTPSELLALAQSIDDLPRLRLRGLMCVLPLAPDKEPGPLFAELASLRQQLLLQAGAGHLQHFDSLSMGMSSDFEAAIAAGATLVRIGTALFGERG